MQKQCAQCSAGFEFSDSDRNLLNKMTPVFDGKDFPIPEPTMCFNCRLQRRLAFYNTRNLYKRECSKTGKNIISMYSPDKKMNIYEKDEWFSDNWSPLDFGRDFDFTRPFFEQWEELRKCTPLPSLSLMTYNQNTEYANDAYKMKNCYMIFDGEEAEDCYYGQTFIYNKNCTDFLHIEHCELCYECTHCYSCYHVFYSQFCHNCRDSYFLRDCIGCKDCFGCANLHQKQYCIFNEQKTREEYDKFIQNFTTSSHAEITKYKNQSKRFFLNHPVKKSRCVQNIDSKGDNLNRSKDSAYCFDCNDMQDSRYCTNCLMGGKDNMDVHIWGGGMELCYDSCCIGERTRNILGCLYVYEGCNNVYYSLFCTRSCNNLFGCIGMIHQNYCILNKQYTPEEYHKLVAKIVEHMKDTEEWGEFFPTKISAFGYNESVADVYFPLKKEEVLERGWQWSDYKSPVVVEKIIDAEQLPDDNTDIPDDVCNWAIRCEITKKPFVIIKQELDFYRFHKLPIPRRHPDQRHKDRFAFTNPFKIFDRKCSNCQKSIQTSYSPERPETVFCEECYLNEVY
ncbi:MAG: hypothetical protein O3A80_02380 [bacterium]|nr:hypothetical protein [bacterium]